MWAGVEGELVWNDTVATTRVTFSIISLLGKQSDDRSVPSTRHVTTDCNVRLYIFSANLGRHTVTSFLGNTCSRCGTHRPLSLFSQALHV